ncbi:MAG: hypothetical protein IKJ26_00195 [Clostridia bacterium]|nr:hypothetical protein [Clostridia bacterium]
MTENDLFQRPASYWLRRAERCRQGGDFVRAAVLERHAVRADKQSDEACLSYVLTLRQLGCYEASNREAFASLAQDPDRRDLYGLIGQNLLALGLRPAGQDALNIYLAQPMTDDLPFWHDDAYDLACDCDGIPPRRRMARFDGLMQAAARCINRGDEDGAQRALIRAGQKPYGVPSAQRELLWALVHLKQGDHAASLARLQNALAIRPDSAQLLSSAAGIFVALGQTQSAYAALAKASAAASVPSSELAVLLASDQLNAPHIVLGMLRRAVKRQPHRTVALYDLCVCLLRLGRLEEAMPHIHLCREIDPDDVFSEMLFTRMTAMQGLDPREIRRQAREISWYGSVTPQELQACAAPVTEMLSEGPQALADAVCADHRLRQRFLQLMALPLDWPGTLLAGVAMAMPPQERAHLMREVLLQHPSPSAAKRVAVAVLHDLNVPPPYAAWQDGRIAWIDPTRPPAETPAFRERLLTLRIRRAQRLCPDDPSIALWGMQQIHRMTPSQRRDVIADPSRIWPLALAIQYRALHDLNPLHIDLHRMGGMRAAALDEALRTLQALPTT